MISTVKSRSSAPIDLGQGIKTATKSPGLLVHPKLHPPPHVSDSKMVRLKLTKPRPPRKNPQDVDWDEDLRPTPNEIVEAKANHGRTSLVNTDPKKSKTIDKKTGNKRTKPSKPSTAPAKRRKSNPTKSTTVKQEKPKPPQLPLITLAASDLAATIDKNELPVSGSLNNPVAKNIVDLPESSHQTSPKNDPKKNRETSPRVSVDIRSCTSVTSDSSSDFDYGIKIPFYSEKVSILEHRAQINGQKNSGQAIRMMSDTSSSSDGDVTKLALEDASKLTILESRATKKQSTKTKAVRETDNSKNHGRAQSVGNKLMLALHGNEDSQHEPDIEDNAPIIISSDPVEPEVPPQPKQSGQPPVKTAPKSVEIERVPEETVLVESRQHQVKSEAVKSPPPVVTNNVNEAEAIDATSGMATWGSFLESLGHSSRSSTEDSSDIEIGRGLMDNGDSILDYHMEAEHLSGFAALQPIRSGPTTLSQVTKPCESQAPTSSGTSIAGKTIDPTVVCIEKRESSHTPESQKPLLPNETLTEFNSPSSQHSKSVPRTSIVDRNGSPRLIPQSAKSVVALQPDLEGEPSYEETRITDTSPSEYDRSSGDPSTESKHEGVIWTKFQRDMFMAYGIETEKLSRSHPWPRPKHQPSFSQEETADGAYSDKDSTVGPGSSQRTIEERGLGAHNVGQFDRSFRTEISGSTQPDMKPHRSSDEDPMEWISTLQVAQKDAHNLLHQTNSNLSIQLAAEKATITRVLEIYRQGCGRILDDLFQAQEARMQLYRQQMQYVKEQHADICQELVRGLQELDRRVQQGPI